MPIVRHQMPDGRVARFEVPEGTAPEQVNAFIQDFINKQSTEPESVEPQQPDFNMSEFVTKPPTLAGIGRSTAQFGQAALEGIAGLGDIAISPITYALNRAGANLQPMAQSVQQAGKAAGIPQPSNQIENVATNTAKMIGPTLATMGIGGPLASTSSSVAANVGKALASQPGQQLAAVTTGGLAANLAKEAGEGPITQFVAGLAGGIAPMTAQKITQGLVNTFGRATTKAAEEILTRNNIDMSGMSITSRKQLLKSVKDAIKTGDVDEAALKRYADYLNLGATPTQGRITLNQVKITHEKNLAKIGAASNDESLQALSNIERDNDMLLTQRINELGAQNADEAITSAYKIMSTLKRIDAPRKAAVDKAYKMVRTSDGRYAFLNTKHFSEKANQYLNEEQLGPALPKVVRTYLNDISSGKTPFNVNTLTQLDKRLSGQINKAIKAGDGETALAVGQVRKALSEAELDMHMQDVGEQTIALYQKARQMAANRFSIIDDTPALKAALDKADPDTFIQTFITGSGNKATVKDVQSLAKQLSSDPEAFEIARNQIANYLRTKATGGAADEVANFSAANFNKALRQLGVAKLRTFFGEDGLKQLKLLGRVASYEKFRPAGSAINTSNTATTIIGRSGGMANQLLNKIPGIGQYIGPIAGNVIRGVASGAESRMALNPSLANQLRQPGGLESLTAPAAGMITGSQ